MNHSRRPAYFWANKERKRRRYPGWKWCEVTGGGTAADGVILKLYLCREKSDTASDGWKQNDCTRIVISEMSVMRAAVSECVFHYALDE